MTNDNFDSNYYYVFEVEVSMKNLLSGLLVLLLAGNIALAETKVITTRTTVPANNNMYANPAYNRDLCTVEGYLFGGDYRDDNLLSRLSRIERKLFGRVYSNMSNAQRMNNILANYRDDYNNKNYLADYYGYNRNPAQRILNRFMGQPTGFTPSIIGTPFDSYGSFPGGINRGYYSNRGYGYNNSVPASMGAGIHILD